MKQTLEGRFTGRPRKQVDVLEVLRLRLEGLSWPAIARRTGLGLGTVYRAYRTAIDALKPFQNTKANRLGPMGEPTPRSLTYTMGNETRQNPPPPRARE
jgi:hypothetical protein